MFFITITVLSILILAAPAEAYILGVNISKNNIERGETTSFTVNVNIGMNEFLDVKSLDLKLIRSEGGLVSDCLFSNTGNIIRGCLGMTIIQIQNADYRAGYGYGFTNGNLTYKIILDTTGYEFGTYSTNLIVNLKDGSLPAKTGETLIIKPGKNEPMQSCSIRAKDGNLNVESADFGANNKLNFYIPNKNAETGDGYLTGQLGRTRFSYTFKTSVQLIENNNERMITPISGKYRVGLGNEIEEDGIIIWNKITNTASVITENINAKDMMVNFRDGCNFSR